MKRNLILSMMLTLAGAWCMLMAATVSPQRAGEIAKQFVSAQSGAKGALQVKSVESINSQLYLVNFTPTGFAIVSSDDTAEPIFGYSTQGSMSTSAMPENMAYIMQEAANMVTEAVHNGCTNKTWSKIENGTFKRESRAGETVEELIKVKWDQPSPYNKYCPGEGSRKAMVGCVAVAMSQAMSVQRYPLRPMGANTYISASYGTLSVDYDKEPDYDWASILAGKDNYDGAARLMYHAGVAVNMNYGADGSGIPSDQVYRITNALKKNFGYGESVAYHWRDKYRGDWDELLLNELYAGRAIVYNAVDTKRGYGHSFNIDGYNDGFYHVNWGWGGYGNGLFRISGLQDSAMNMNYDSGHVAVVGIGAPNSSLRGIALSDLTVENNLAAGVPVAALYINGELPTADQTITMTGEYYPAIGGYRDIPFTYRDGLVYTNELFPTWDTPTVYVRFKVEDDKNSVNLTQGYTLTIEAPQKIEKKTAVRYDRTTKDFKVHTKFGAKYVVKNARGEQVLTGDTKALPDFEFNRSILSEGTNVLEVSRDGDVKTVKIEL